MSSQPLTRRRFLAVAGVALGGTLAAGAAWLFRGDSVDTISSPSTTLLQPPPSTSATAAPATTTATSSTTRPPETTTTTSTTAPPVTNTVEIICKEAWGAQPVAGEFIGHTIDNITVHHTAAVLAANTAAPARARQHQSYHQSLGWPDLAYHFLIDANGHVYEGRPVEAVGDTATDYDPTGHFLVGCEGNFNTQQITPAQYKSLVKVLAWGVAEFGVDADSIRGHRDVASTTCPGDNLYPLVADGAIAADVTAQLAVAAPSLELVCGQRADEIVAGIEAGTI